MIAVIATVTLGYGTKVVVNRSYLNTPTMSKLPTIGDLRASLEKLNIWRKSAKNYIKRDVEAQFIEKEAPNAPRKKHL